MPWIKFQYILHSSTNSLQLTYPPYSFLFSPNPPPLSPTSFSILYPSLLSFPLIATLLTLPLSSLSPSSQPLFCSLLHSCNFLTLSPYSSHSPPLLTLLIISLPIISLFSLYPLFSLFPLFPSSHSSISSFLTHLTPLHHQLTWLPSPNLTSLHTVLHTFPTHLMYNLVHICILTNWIM